MEIEPAFQSYPSSFTNGGRASRSRDSVVPIPLEVRMGHELGLNRNHREKGMSLVTNELGYKRACWVDKCSRLSDLPTDDARSCLVLPNRSRYLGGAFLPLSRIDRSSFA